MCSVKKLSLKNWQISPTCTRKNETPDTKVGPETQEPQVGPMVGSYGGTQRWDPKVGP